VSFELCEHLFIDKSGIEIGGPSAIFDHILPIYSKSKQLDGCNFSRNTAWGNIGETELYNYGKSQRGSLYIREASDLIGIPNSKYDFLLASHCLEHCANALKTVRALLLILPDKRFTFDHKRNISTFDHLLEDYYGNVGETDLTHLDEILASHDLFKDWQAGSLEQFKDRSLDNFNNRCLHQHVFDFSLLKEIYHYFDISISQMFFKEPCHQIIIGVKA
jgi:hypothetical protein